MCVCSHCEDRKMKSSCGCLSHILLHGLLWYKGRKLSETCDPSTSLAQKTPQTMFLWALLYPAAAQYTDSTWTAPVWAGHCTQLDFQVEDCPLTLTPTHTFAHHILMLQQRFTNFLLKHEHTVIPLASLLLENLFSWFTGIWRNMWTWGKWSTSKVNVIPVAFTFPFSTLYVVTFSDLDYWDHNWGLFDNSVASRGSLISWNNITWSPTPIHHPRQSVMMMQLHIILPRNALFTLL